MTEVKALTAFTDKETGVFHKVGDLFSCEDSRANELAEKKAVEVVSVKADAPAEKPKKRVVKKKG